MNWFTYQNDDDFDAKSMIRCPNLDVMINTSRTYYRIIVPHDNYDPNWNCVIKPGMKVDVIFTEYGGADPHAMLLNVATELGMDVYMPQPGIPDNSAYWPAFFEFTRRATDSYSARFGHLAAYKGVCCITLYDVICSCIKRMRRVFVIGTL